MILVDTGPLVALFDPKDPDHEAAAAALGAIREPALTTVAVLTEAFHLLGPASKGSKALRAMIGAHGLGVHFLDGPALSRAFELMDRWADRPMDLADASLVVAPRSREHCASSRSTATTSRRTARASGAR